VSEARDHISINLHFFEGDTFSGPLDLLLYLIKKNEVDVHDIPVGLITEQYLEHLARLEELNLDAAGDFLVMAATLTQIKSRLLLPTPDDGTEEPEEDPRMTLARPLLEYAQVREMGESLGERLLLDRDVFSRGSFEDFDESDPAAPKPEERPLRVSLFELVRAWKGLAEKIPKATAGINFKLETVTIGEKLNEIRLFMLEKKNAHFKELAGENRGKLTTALSFLATLELARIGFLRLHQDNEEDGSGPRLFLANPDAETGPEFDYR
jgi:segregation and condensation protein A